jgi:hypothetical protein
MPIDTYNPLGSPLIVPAPSAPSNDPNGERRRLEDLAAKLVKVPKKELDDKCVPGSLQVAVRRLG